MVTRFFCVVFILGIFYTHTIGRTSVIRGCWDPESAGEITAALKNLAPVSYPDPGFAGLRVLTTSTERNKIIKP